MLTKQQLQWRAAALGSRATTIRGMGAAILLHTSSVLRPRGTHAQRVTATMTTIYERRAAGIARRLGLWDRDIAESLALVQSRTALARATNAGRFGAVRPLSEHIQRYARWEAGADGTPHPVKIDDAAGYPRLIGSAYEKYHWHNCGASGTVYHPSTHRIVAGPAWAARMVSARLVERRIDGVRTLLRSAHSVRIEGNTITPARTAEARCYIVQRGRRTYHAERSAAVSPRDALSAARIAWAAQDRHQARDRRIDHLLATRADSIYVSLADSLSAGNCLAGTLPVARAIAGDIVDAIPELACASASAVLAASSSARARAACRVAALRYV